MRFLTIALIVVLLLIIVGFTALNAGVVTTVTLWDRPLEDIPLYMVVIVSILVGIVCAGIVAVAEGTGIRLANRRLTRQVQKMETEINYLRTQPPVQGRPEPDDLNRGHAGGEEGPEARERSSGAPPPPSAPVYGTGPDEDDDDTYTGGRAV